MKAYPDFRKSYDTQALTANTQMYSLPSDFLSFYRVDVNYSSSTAADAYKAKFEGEESGYPDTTYSTSDPRIFIRGTQFGLNPTPTSTGGYVFMWYWNSPGSMTDDTDEHGLPYGARECLVAYSLYRAWLAKDQEKSSRYKSLYEDMLGGLIEFAAQQRQTITKPKTNIVFGLDMYEYDY